MWCGVDIVAVDRIKKALNGDKGLRFKEKVFTLTEIEYCENKSKGKHERYAARFAAKEAFSKALGRGFDASVHIKEIEVINDQTGKPRIEVHGQTKDVFLGLGCKNIEISISHEKEYAVAFVLIM